MHRIAPFIILCTLSACSDDEPKQNESQPDPEPETFLPACDESDFAPGPLTGPGFDPASGLIAPIEDSYVISTTAVFYNRDNLPRFLELSGDVSAAMMNIDGFVAASLGLATACGMARTLTVWRSVDAMYELVTAEAHATAMAESDEVTDMGAVTHWEVPSSDMPVTWEIARERIAKVPTF